MQTEAPGLGVSKEGFDFEAPPIPALSFREASGAGHQIKMLSGRFIPQDGNVQRTNLLMSKVDLA